MAAKDFLVAASVLLTLSFGYATKRSFTTRLTPTQSGVCASNPCIHGQCQPHPAMNTYICKCIHGASGRNCEKEIDMCLFNPCVFGNCSGHGINFTCACDKGHTGRLCDKEIDMCLFNPCVFGTCSGQGINFTCTCDKGYGGRLCDKACADTVQNCAMLNKASHICFDDGARVYAQQNCARTCGLCDTCSDVVANCKSYDPSICTSADYKQWSSLNCAATCNMCSSMTSGKMTGTETGTGGIMTGSSSACSDVIANCKSYDPSICTSADYKQWALQNCAATCDMCSSMTNGTMTGGTGTETGGFMTGSSSDILGCVYNSHLYRQGESWKDGCKFSCQCVDESTGKYYCSQLCLQWDQFGEQLCHRKPPAPGKCCETLSCPPGFTIYYPQGYTEQ